MFDLRGVLTLLTALGAAGCGALTEEGDAAEVSQPVAAQRRYVSEDRKECQVVFFVCARGESPFFDACGCGCSRP